LVDSHRESLLTLDNIRLELPIAGVGSRCLAGLVDGFFVGMAVLLWLVLCFAVVFSASRGWALAAAVAGIFLIEWGYFAALEVATGGRTLGKMALDLRVVSAEGAQAGAGSLLLRNLVRDFDYLCGVPLMAIDPLARRIGDRLAGTVVVHERPRAAAPRLGRVPAGWGAREVTVTERFLAAERELADAGLRIALARQLLGRIGRDAPELLAGLDPGDPVRALRQALQVEGA
jgi:uncharacterized RDD family membrane protein YckC